MVCIRQQPQRIAKATETSFSEIIQQVFRSLVRLDANPKTIVKREQQKEIFLNIFFYVGDPKPFHSACERHNIHTVTYLPALSSVGKKYLITFAVFSKKMNRTSLAFSLR